MSDINEFVREIGLFLSCQPEFAGVDFVPAFPGVMKPSPLQNPVVALEAEKVCLCDAGIGQPEKKVAEIALCLTVYSPISAAASEGTALLNRLLQFLVFSPTYCVTKCTTTAITSSKSTGAFVVSGTVILQGKATKEE